jgi:Flp pilus assembly protein TadB
VTAPAVGALAIAAAVLAVAAVPLAASWHPRLGSHPDRAALEDAGWRHGVGRWECLRLVATVAGLAIGGALGASPLVAAGLAIAPSFGVRLRAQAARDRARPALTRLLQQTHALLRSGVALPDALRRAAAATDDAIARRPFELALRRFDLGDPLDVAIRAAAGAARDGRAAAALHTLALGVSERLPIERAAALLEAMAERGAYGDRLDAEVRARAAGVRVQSYVLAAVVPGLALYLGVTMPGLGATLGTGLGRGVLIPAAVALEIAGIAASRRIVRSVSTW